MDSVPGPTDLTFHYLFLGGLAGALILGPLSGLVARFVWMWKGGGYGLAEVRKASIANWLGTFACLGCSFVAAAARTLRTDRVLVLAPFIVAIVVGIGAISQRRKEQRGGYHKSAPISRGTWIIGLASCALPWIVQIGVQPFPWRHAATATLTIALLSFYANEWRKLAIGKRDLSESKNLGSGNWVATEDRVSIESSVGEALQSLAGLRQVIGSGCGTSCSKRVVYEASTRFIGSLSNNAGALAELVQRMRRAPNDCSLVASSVIAEVCLNSQVSLLRQAKLMVSPGVYTELVLGIANRFAAEFGSVTVDIFTTMLPTDFYNWPQIATKPTPNGGVAVVRHTWNGAKEYFTALGELSSNVEVRRIILVQDDTRGRQLPTIRRLDELRHIASCYVHSHPYSRDQFGMLGMQGLFHKASGLSFQDALEIPGIDDMEFVPIGPKELFQESWLEPHGSLLNVFIRTLHSNPSLARYCALSGEQLSNRILNPFGVSVNYSPEIAVFSTGVDAQPAFGMVASLKPYSHEMGVALVAESVELDRLVSLRELAAGSSPLEQLLNPGQC